MERKNALGNQKVFTPIAIGAMTLKNRIVMAPTLHEMCYEGHPTEAHIAVTDTYSKSGVSMVCVGGAAIDTSPPGVMFASGLSIGHDKFIYGVARLSEVIRANGAKSCLQILHPGRGAARYWVQSDPDFVPWGASSKVPFFMAPKWEITKKDGKWDAAQTMNPVPVREITLDEIEQVVKLHALAVLRAKKAGFDAVNLHFANITLIMDFISPYTNVRNDAYGGDWERRMRLPCEIIEAAKAAAGKGYPLITRIPADQGLGEAGIRIEDVVRHIVPRLEEAGADAIDISAGLLDHTPHVLMPPMYYPRGLWLRYSEAIKKKTKLPVIVAGRLCDPKLIIKAVEQGRCDVVALTRPLMADNIMPRKMMEGRSDDVRMCVACGYCVTEYGWSKYCSINPDQARELVLPKIEPADRPRKILVAGGGPGGMEAALILRQRGHEVTLCEKADQLGGYLRIASAMTLTREWRTFTRWQSKQLEKLGVKIRLDTDVTRELVKELRPDAVVVATGSSSRRDVEGADQPNVVTEEDVLLRGVEIGGNVVVLGGAFWDVEVAISLADQGKNVTLVREAGNISIAELGPMRAMAILTGMLQQKKIVQMFSTKARKIEKTGVTVTDREGNAVFVNADTVLLSMGRVRNRKLFNELQEVIQELYEVGDCTTPDCVADAVLAGRIVGSTL